MLAGHDVQIHGYAHLRHPYTPREDVEDDIDRALSVIPRRRSGGSRGDTSPTTRRRSREQRGLTIVGWDADTHDWRGDSAEAMLEQLRLEPGGIVLAHDGVGSGARRETAIETARLVPPLVRGSARRKGSSPARCKTPWPTSRSRSATRTSRRDALVFEEIAANAAHAGRAPRVPDGRDGRADEAATPPTTARRGVGAGPRSVAKADGSRRAHLRGPPERAGAARGSTGSTPRTTGSASGARTRPRTRASRRTSKATSSTARRCSAPAPAGSTRALVIAKGTLVYVDLHDNVEVDKSWYRAGGMRASESHRVHFHGARIIATLTPLTTRALPRPATRSAPRRRGRGSWTARSSRRSQQLKDDDLRAHAAGRHGRRAADDRPLVRVRGGSRRPDPGARSRSGRPSPTPARRSSSEAARATGSRPFATGTALDRARRDFELFVLQHRLDPLVDPARAASGSKQRRRLAGALAVELLGLGLVPRRPCGSRPGTGRSWTWRASAWRARPRRTSRSARSC